MRNLKKYINTYKERRDIKIQKYLVATSQAIRVEDFNIMTDSWNYKMNLY